jgi:nucleoside-diphosphate-sugar epimerase
MTRVLVLGGTRFLGPPIVGQLVEAGHDVVVFHRGEREPAEASQAEHVHGDFTRLPEYISRRSRRKPEVVIDVVPSIDKDGHGVRHFRGIADRAVVVTSLDVYRAFAVAWGSDDVQVESMPLTEDSATRSGPSPDLTPDIDFDNLEVEQALADDTALPTTVLRLPMIYGAGDPQRRLARYIRRMSDGRPAIILDERIAVRRWSRGYVENVAAAVARAAVDERARGRTYNVAETTTPNEAEWVGLLGEACGWSGEILALPSGRLPESMRTRLRTEQDLIVSSARLRTDLHFEEPIPLAEGLRRTIEWERAEAQNEPQPDYSVEDRVLAALT